MEVAPQAMMETVEIGSINILDKATLPEFPMPINLYKNTIIAALIGLFLGLGIAILHGILFYKIKNSKDIEGKLNLPTLGEIQHANHTLRKKGLLLSSETPQAFVESFMMLESIIRYIANNNNIKKILITSSLEHEGKTLVSVNLATTLAKNGKSVLLIDCDLRKPNIYKSLNIKKDETQDFYSILSSEQNNPDFSKCIVKMPSGISVIPFICSSKINNVIFTYPSLGFPHFIQRGSPIILSLSLQAPQIRSPLGTTISRHTGHLTGYSMSRSCCSNLSHPPYYSTKRALRDKRPDPLKPGWTSRQPLYLLYRLHQTNGLRSLKP
jgi:hypothetical protein